MRLVRLFPRQILTKMTFSTSLRRYIVPAILLFLTVFLLTLSISLLLPESSVSVVRAPGTFCNRGYRKRVFTRRSTLRTTTTPGKTTPGKTTDINANMPMITPPFPDMSYDEMRNSSFPESPDLYEDMMFEPMSMNKSLIGCAKWRRLTESVQLCVATKLISVPLGDLWQHLNKIVESCGNLLGDILGAQFLPTRGSYRPLIDFADKNNNRSDCSAVSIGIGSDIIPEVQFLKKLPKCKLYGADPVHKMGLEFKKVGKFYPVAISNETGSKATKIMKDPDDNSNFLVSMKMHMGLTDFLKNVTIRGKHASIDYLYVDAEGYEYEMLPLLWNSNGLLAHNISVCQMTFNLHGPVEKFGYKKRDWDVLIRTLLLRTNFVPLWSPPPLDYHQIFLINTDDQICMDKFFKNWC